MPTVNPRVNVVLEKPLYEELRRWAQREGVSLSLKVRDLVKEALEEEEDRILVRLAEEREKTFDRAKALTHRELWPPKRRSRR
jgi:metal-responsive CopG/Arc/MetJ family transcriptional regulator